MVEALKLCYRNILLTGSKGQGDSLAKFLIERGAQVYHVPLLEIVPIPTLPQSKLMPVTNYRHVFFMSPNAVRCGLSLLPTLRTHLNTGTRSYAVGEESAKLLCDQGIKPQVPPHASSESLLELSELASIGGDRVLIVRGVGGRNLLAKRLRERGAQVDYLPSYRRVMRQEDAPLLQELLRKRSCEAVVMSSVTVLRSAYYLADKEQSALFSLPICVPSARVAKQARGLGYKNILPASGPYPDDIYKALCGLTRI